MTELCIAHLPVPACAGMTELCIAHLPVPACAGMTELCTEPLPGSALNEGTTLHFPSSPRRRGSREGGQRSPGSGRVGSRLRGNVDYGPLQQRSQGLLKNP